jgi:hypothetical protein
MPDSQSPSPDPSESSFGAESIIERALRQSMKGQETASSLSSASFSDEDHLHIAGSGAADLSLQEKGKLIDTLHDRIVEHPASKAQPSAQPLPLFFGSWSGMNPFRLVKPFFLQKKRNTR